MSYETPCYSDAALMRCRCHAALCGVDAPPRRCIAAAASRITRECAASALYVVRYAYADARRVVARVYR